ncbi:MAG: hypothetical protein ABIF85_04280 [Nanoarchaeota archaeon]|nr:hypothetical protein [Nanoarchaeota archaeon]MBU4300618.1 hypothetical protein [Nanoarchaeota archaeon]MBU4452171.1 hypothetical protein [Nanoarchaeota archaeon]MCG2724211.1 hypothetical protein [archaeon]
MAAIEDKNKIKVIPLISEMDRRAELMRNTAPTNISHIPTKDEIRKKSLDDMLKRINSRG